METAKQSVSKRSEIKCFHCARMIFRMSDIRKSLTNLSPTQIFFNNSLLLLERTKYWRRRYCLSDDNCFVSQRFSSKRRASINMDPKKSMTTIEFQWTDDEFQLLLEASLEFRSRCEFKGVSWESKRNKYKKIKKIFVNNILTLMMRSKDVNTITKDRVTSRLKTIETNLRKAVDSGKRSHLVYVSVQINLTFTLKKLLNEVLEYKSFRLPVSTCESFRSTSKRNLSATSCFGFKSEMEWNLSGMKNAPKYQVYSGNRRPIQYVFHFEMFRSDCYPV